MSESNGKRDILQPHGGKSFNELMADLRPRPQYLGPGKWKQALRRMLEEEERRSK